MYKKILTLVLLLLFAAEPASAGLNVVATLPWVGALASEIGKDKIEVKVLVKPTQDAHYIEAKPSMILAVRKADILMYNGLDLEVGYLPVLLESSRNPKIQSGMSGNFNCSGFVEVIKGPAKVDRSMGDVHPFGNPHYHFSPGNILKVAGGIAERLAEIDQANADFYRTNMEAFRKRWNEKKADWSKRGIEGRSFVAFHKYFEYLAADFGFSIGGYVEEKPGIPPSADHLRKLISLMKEEKIGKILTTSYSSRREVNFIAKKTGAEIVILPHDVGSGKKIGNWFDLMDEVLNKLR